jgi:hypothetical protein
VLLVVGREITDVIAESAEEGLHLGLGMSIAGQSGRVDAQQEFPR